jgi:hypothetical protein
MLGYAGNLASETISTASADGKTITLTKDVTGDGVIAALGKPAAEASQAEVARARPDLPRRLAAGRGRRCSSRPTCACGQDYRYPTISLDATAGRCLYPLD